MSDVVLDEHGVEFADSDGEPMAETHVHADQMAYLYAALQELARRRGEQGAYVGMNQLFYWDPKDAKQRLAPDVYRFAPGLAEPGRLRRSWKLWQEARTPDLIIEVASDETWESDLGPKKELYRTVFRTPEYVIFDPLPEAHCQEPLQAFRLVGRSYRRDDAGDAFESRVLGATLRVIEGRLRIVDTDGQVVPGDPAAGREVGLREGREVGLREGREVGLREGREAGVREGREVGLREARREALVGVLEARFGPLAPALHARIDELDAAALQRSVIRAGTASSAEAALSA
jgi:Uma2 family endonuclease